jgi:hypothetical protein
MCQGIKYVDGSDNVFADLGVRQRIAGASDQVRRQRRIAHLHSQFSEMNLQFWQTRSDSAMLPVMATAHRARPARCHYSREDTAKYSPRKTIFDGTNLKTFDTLGQIPKFATENALDTMRIGQQFDALGRPYPGALHQPLLISIV